MEYRLVEKTDFLALSDYYIRNQNHFKVWSPEVSYDYHFENKWEARINDCIRDQLKGSAYYFIAEDGGKIYGHCTLSSVSRGVFHACYMGYGVCKTCEGQGVAFELARAAVDFAFKEINLNRVMAAYMPHNNRSTKLLKRLGFQREGFAKNYLQINGRWENHVLTSLLNQSR